MANRSTWEYLKRRLGTSGGNAGGAPRTVDFTTNGATIQNDALIGKTGLVITVAGVAQYINENYTFDGNTGTVTWVTQYENGQLGTIQY